MSSYLGLIHTQTFEHRQAERSGRTAHTKVCPSGGGGGGGGGGDSSHAEH